MTSEQAQVVPVIRLFHSGLGQHFIVAGGQVYTDLDQDGYISSADRYIGPAESALLAAASHFGAYFDVPFPGAKSMDPQITSGGRLNDKEAQEFLHGCNGVVGKRPDLMAHLDFFDRFDRDGMIGLRENYRGWRDLGYGLLRSLMLAMGSAIVFGRVAKGFQIDIERIADKRPKGSTGMYGPDGNIDATRLEQFTSAFDEVADGVLTHEQLRRAIAHRVRLGRIPTRQFKSLFALTQRINGSNTITKKQFLAMFDNSLFWTVVSVPDRSGKRKL